MIIIKALIITIFVAIFMAIIIEGINQQNIKYLNREKRLKEQLISLLQNEQDKTDTLYKIIKHIQGQLKLTNIKECPEEEKQVIVNEIIMWIDQLEKINNGDENELHK